MFELESKLASNRTNLSDADRVRELDSNRNALSSWKYFFRFIMHSCLDHGLYKVEWYKCSFRKTWNLSFYKLKLSKDSYLILNDSAFSGKENIVKLNVNLKLNKKFRIISVFSNFELRIYAATEIITLCVLQFRIILLKL